MNVAGNVNNASKPYTGQGSAGMLINMYYATPFPVLESLTVNW